MSALWVLGGLVVAVLLIAVVGLRLGAHPSRGHCGPMCQLGQAAHAPGDAAAAPSPHPETASDDTSAPR